MGIRGGSVLVFRRPAFWIAAEVVEIGFRKHGRVSGNTGAGPVDLGPEGPRRARQAQAGGKEHGQLGGFLRLSRAKNGSLSEVPLSWENRRSKGVKKGAESKTNSDKSRTALGGLLQASH